MVPLLIQEGHEVVGLDTGLFEGCSFPFGSTVTIPAIRRDLRDVTPEDVSGFDAVVHLANISNDPIGNLNPDLTFEVNHRATVRLAELSREAGVKRFLFSSSCSLYGAAGDAPLTEEAAFNPVTPYGEAKVLAERDISALACDGFSPTHMRNATAYGMSPRLRFDLVLNNLVAWAVTTGQIYMKSDGSPWRPIVHIRDISQAFACVLRAPVEDVHNQAFNVGRSEENYRIREIAEAVGQVVPGCEVAFADDASPDKRSYQVNFDKIRTVLPDFRPEWTARKGAAEVYAALRQAELTPEDFEGRRYRRIKHLLGLMEAGRLTTDLRWTPERADRAAHRPKPRVHTRRRTTS